jgi:hypothetical protein
LARSSGDPLGHLIPEEERADIWLCDERTLLDARQLTEQLKKAKGAWGTGCAMRALGESKTDAGRQAIAVRLQDPRASVRWDARAAMRDIADRAGGGR